MFCIQCGTQLPDKSKFCPQCGAPSASANKDSDNAHGNNDSRSKNSQQNPNSLLVRQKIEIGYITFAVVFVIASIVCLSERFLTSFAILIIGSIVACALIFPAIKATKGLSSAEAEDVSRLVQKWKLPLQILPIIYILSMAICWVALI